MASAPQPAPFSFSYPGNASPQEIEAARKEAHGAAVARSINRRAAWFLNDSEACPGAIFAVRLRNGRFLECEDGPEVLGLSWRKLGEDSDVVEYFAEEPR